MNSYDQPQNARGAFIVNKDLKRHATSSWSEHPWEYEEQHHWYRMLAWKLGTAANLYAIISHHALPLHLLVTLCLATGPQKTLFVLSVNYY